MPIEIFLPAAAATMGEVKLAKWLKREGDQVRRGEPIAEVESDKAVIEVETEQGGVICRLLVAEGSLASSDSAIALLVAEGEDRSVLGAFNTGAPRADEPAKTGPAPSPRGVSREFKGSSLLPNSVGTPQPLGNRIFCSPLARRLASAGNLDLAQISGSGPHGRIVKCDVEAALAARLTTPPSDIESAAPVTHDVLTFLPEYQMIPHSAMRKSIARRLTESSQQAPHFFLTIDCELDRLLDLRNELNGVAGTDFKLSINDFIFRAAALALKKVPAANAMWTDDAILQFDQVDISVAVAIEGGLITPVVRNAGAKGLAQISKEIRELAEKARRGRLMPSEYLGGTFSISNLGMFGIKSFTSIINPPQGCILSVGAGDQRPVVKDGALAIAMAMTVTLAADHRCVDGTVGAEFLAAFRYFIEKPLAMLL